MENAITPPGTNSLTIGLTLNALYYFGMSDSPSMVILTAIEKDRIELLTPASGKRQVHARWIAEDLLVQGCRTWLSMGYGEYAPERAESLKAMLAGQAGKAEILSDWGTVSCVVDAAERGAEAEDGGMPQSLADLCDTAERYGSLCGQRIGGRWFLVVTGYRAVVRGLGEDPRFRVVSIKEEVR